MKKRYFLSFLIATFCFKSIQSQTCPENSFIIPASNPEEIVFLFESPGGPDCGTRPAAISIDGSAYILDTCDTFSTRYVLSSGSGVADPNSYSVTYGASTCEYSGGTLLGLDDHLLAYRKTLKLYPNPVTTTDNITVSSPLNMTAEVSIYNLLGKLVLKDNVVNKYSKEINISALENGMYLMQLKIDNGIITKKIIISK